MLAVQPAHDRKTIKEGDVSDLAFSPTSNMIAFTSLDGSFTRWTSPIPAGHPDPVKTEEASAKALDRLLDDDFGDDLDEDMEDKGEDVDDMIGEADDWIVDDDGLYAAEDGERTRGGRTEVGKWFSGRDILCDH
jgi:chromosome transmission fidelity protein 4